MLLNDTLYNPVNTYIKEMTFLFIKDCFSLYYWSVRFLALSFYDDSLRENYFLGDLKILGGTAECRDTSWSNLLGKKLCHPLEWKFTAFFLFVGKLLLRANIFVIGSFVLFLLQTPSSSILLESRRCLSRSVLDSTFMVKKDVWLQIL